MFNSRKPNKLVNRNHERCLYEPCMMMQEASTIKGFYDLVKLSVFAITISNLNYRRVQKCPPIVKMFFSFIENKYNLRNFQKMKQEKIEPIRIGLETALYHALQLAKFPGI